MPYITNTEEQRQQMLKEIGVDRFTDLLVGIPAELRLKSPLKLPEPKSELEITRHMNDMAALNQAACSVNSFLGGGIYDHYIPAAVDHVIMRPEFLTAYTPYQAEVSQGTLQFIYEFQTMICELTGMEIANAGMYDGATACAEAVLMASRQTKKERVLISSTIHPVTRDVIRAYTEGIGLQLDTIAHRDGCTDADHLKDIIDDSVCCVVVQSPNFLGNIEMNGRLAEITHQQKKALFVSMVDPVSLALLKAPGDYGADIVIGEGQALGNKPNFGGPLFGFFATRKNLARNMPGRIVGATVDADGKRAYALTLQAREQHIRRAKATSNICSNQSLACLAATVYLCLMGPAGLREVAVQSTTKAHYLARKIAAIDGFELAFGAPFFKEFAFKTPLPPVEIIARLEKKNIYPGIDLTPMGYKNLMLTAVTEKKSRQDMDSFIEALQEETNG